MLICCYSGEDEVVTSDQVPCSAEPEASDPDVSGHTEPSCVHGAVHASHLSHSVSAGTAHHGIQYAHSESL